MAEEPEELIEGQEPEETAEDGLSDAEAEVQARRQGWVAESEWDEARAERTGRVKPKRFMSAREFLALPASDPVILRGRLRTLESKFTRVERQNADLTRNQQEQAELIRFQAEQTKKIRDSSYQRGIKEAEERMARAVPDGDTEAFNAAKAERDRIESEAREEVKPQPRQPQQQARPQVDPEIPGWVAKNPWFNADPILNQIMIAMHNEVLRDQPELGTGEAGLEEAKRRVMEKFPEKFPSNRRRQAPSTVAQPSGERGGKTNGVGAEFARLPAEARVKFAELKAKFAKQKVTYTEAEYLEAYNS